MGGTKLIVNEDGRHLDLPFNSRATVFADQPIVGDVILLLSTESIADTPT
jgi:hypothetical protein